MLLTEKEKREIRKDMRTIWSIMAKWGKIITEATILGIPGEEREEPEVEIMHVGYDDEQCARNK